MPIGVTTAIIGAAGAVGSALIGSHAASKASNTQQQGAVNAAAPLAPYAQTGVDALNKQRAMYGLGPVGAPTTAPVSSAPITAPKSGPTFGIASLPTALEADPGSAGPGRIQLPTDNANGGPFASMTRSSFGGM